MPEELEIATHDEQVERFLVNNLEIPDEAAVGRVSDRDSQTRQASGPGDGRHVHPVLADRHRPRCLCRASRHSGDDYNAQCQRPGHAAIIDYADFGTVNPFPSFPFVRVISWTTPMPPRPSSRSTRSEPEVCGFDMAVTGACLAQVRSSNAKSSDRQTEGKIGPSISMSLAAGTHIGPYEILAFLGAGGMGEVYSARDHRLQRSVAIKVLSASQDTDAARRERFTREARAIARLSHPYICTLYDVGQERLRPARGATPPGTDDAGEVTFLVMELLEGETLADRLERGALSLDRALPIAVQVAEALAAAHKKGVIHRDLKPGNLMLTPTGVKLLDFGLAKLREAEDTDVIAADTRTAFVTDRHVVMGTLPYMAPEQIEGHEIDARTDIFSFGVMVFEMIAGRRPFGGNTRASLMAAIVGAEPLSLADIEPATPPALARLIGRCLAKDPELRWQTARDLAIELRWFAETRPDKAAAAVPPTHWSRRAVIIGGLATLAVVVGTFAAIAGFTGQKQTPAPVYTQVTFRRGAVSSARFAPDGQSFVYSASWEGDPYRVFLGRPASPDARDLGLDLGRILSISRASDMAVLFGPQTISHTFGTRTLASVPMAGGARHDLHTGIVDADWIPGSNDLAVIRDPGDGRPWTVEFPAGKTVHEARAAWSLRVSPDGSRIAFFEGPAIFDGSPDGNVTVIDRTGRTTVVSKNWVALGLAWAPSGREIWFTATRIEKRAGRADDSSLPAPSLQAVSLTGEDRSIQHAPDWLVLHDIASDGRALVSRNTIHIGLSCQAPGESRERDLSWQIASFATGLSADGRTVVFNDTLGGRTPSGNATVFSRNLDGSPAVRLGEGTGGRLSPGQEMGAHATRGPPGASACRRRHSSVFIKGHPRASGNGRVARRLETHRLHGLSGQWPAARVRAGDPRRRASRHNTSGCPAFRKSCRSG